MDAQATKRLGFGVNGRYNFKYFHLSEPSSQILVGRQLKIYENMSLITFQDDAASETSEEFTLDDNDDDKDDDEDVSRIFMAPTLACDDVEDSNQSEPNGEGVLEMETQAVGEAETQAVGEGETQAVRDDKTQVMFVNQNFY